MHPAPSVILFSVLSGIGFGFLAYLCAGFGAPYGTFASFFIGFALAVGGLLFSTAHLANPKNAIKAFRQVSTSWLSREGVIAVLTLVLAGLYAASLIFMNKALPVIGVLASIGCIITVFCTAMIYTQLKTVPRWNHPLTPIVFMLSALVGGTMLIGFIKPAIIFLIALIVVQIAYWLVGDGQFEKSGSTIETATGLGRIGKTRLFESPHSGSNYLLKEMVHVIGRKHAIKLRMIALALAGVLPILILAMAPISAGTILLAVVVHLIGQLAARWLFFAEAEHVVGLYYDKR